MGYFNSTFGVFTTFSNDINKQKNKKKTNNEETIRNGNKYKNRLKPGTLVNQSSRSYHDLTFSGYDYLSLSLLLVSIIFKQCVR